MTTYAEERAPTREDFTFAELLVGHEDDYPTLARAVRGTSPAHDVRIEWLVDALGGHYIWHNYQQIFRFPYRGPVQQGSDSEGGHDSAQEARKAFLAAVEQTLEHGVPSDERARLRMPITSCGGYRHFLGRDLNKNDRLVLRPLREPFLWTHEWGMVQGEWTALDTPKYEWLAETSLMVVPGAAWRRQAADQRAQARHAAQGTRSRTARPDAARSDRR